jgi:hypothetical protein
MLVMGMVAQMLVLILISNLRSEISKGETGNCKSEMCDIKSSSGESEMLRA